MASVSDLPPTRDQLAARTRLFTVALMLIPMVEERRFPIEGDGLARMLRAAKTAVSTAWLAERGEVVRSPREEEVAVYLAEDGSHLALATAFSRRELEMPRKIHEFPPGFELEGTIGDGVEILTLHPDGGVELGLKETTRRLIAEY